MKIAVIPARGGSKRIPRKNIKPFAGSPMISYAINAARASGLFSHIVVSTDDEEIADISRKLGAETPFVRPADLADDHATTASVIVHAIERCDSLGWQVGAVCCIYPAVPFLRAPDLVAAWKLYEASSADYCFPVAEFPSAVQRALHRDADGRLSPIDPANELVRTQDLKPAFFDAGQFYWGSKEAWLGNPRIHSNGIGFVVPGWRAVDIDTADDWDRAELIHQIVQKAPDRMVRA